MVRVLALLAGVVCGMAQAEVAQVAAADGLARTGLIDHLLPRFSLKTGIRLRPGDDNPVARFGDAGDPAIAGPDGNWNIEVLAPEGAQFEQWLRSDIGRRTVADFATGQFAVVTVAPGSMAATAVTGDVGTGQELSLALCGRCHVIDDTNRMNGLGSTPSFAVLRTLPNWQERFESFYVLKPHGAFTQVADVTPPFDPMLPPPIAPLELTLDDLDAILAYAHTVAPADLGASVQSR